MPPANSSLRRPPASAIESKAFGQRTSRELEFRYKYGLLGAGAVGSSLIGQLPARAKELGPVSAVSYRVASRIANTLRAGFPVRTTGELRAARCILFHAPPEFVEPLIDGLEEADIGWEGRALVI